MSYFANATEADAFMHNWCMRCRNWRDRSEEGYPLDGANGCPVMDLHFAYSGPNARARPDLLIAHAPPPGAAVTEPPVYDLYRDPREHHPLKYQGMWTVAYFADMKARHMAFKKKFPDRAATRAVPYEGIENLRTETKALLEAYTFAAQPAEEFRQGTGIARAKARPTLAERGDWRSET